MRLTDVQLFCLRNQELRSGVTRESKNKVQYDGSWLRPSGNAGRCTILTQTAREGREITQLVKVPRCTATLVPARAEFHPLEFEHRRMREQRSERSKMFLLDLVVTGVLQGNVSSEPPGWLSHSGCVCSSDLTPMPDLTAPVVLLQVWLKST